MNSGQIFILLIVLAAITAGIINRYLRLKSSAPREDSGQRSRIEALEQRVQTLERIVTDRGYDLKREFDKL